MLFRSIDMFCFFIVAIIGFRGICLGETNRHKIHQELQRNEETRAFHESKGEFIPLTIETM